MHILIIHQAFASINEPGGTRHHELAQVLTARGHRVTVVASPVSYLTGSPSRVARGEGLQRHTHPPAGEHLMKADCQ